MKIIHLNRNSSSLKTGQDFLDVAKQFEKQDDIQQALSMYQLMIKKNFNKQFGYQRMMILLRRAKEYKKELKIVDDAIADFKLFYSKRNKLSDKKAIRTSHNLIRLLGMNGDITTFPEPIPGWVKRREGLKKILARRK